MGTLFSSPPAPTPAESPHHPLRVVLISDTHNDHRALQVPPGDILIHAGDFTCFGKVEHLSDFNDWLGSLPHPHKIVVNGNHENNAPWQPRLRSLLTNAIFLKDEIYRIPRTRKDGAICEDTLNIFGTNFFWPMKKGEKNPHYGSITNDVHVLVCHGPVDGYVDGNSGCPAMLEICERLASESLQLVVSGHIHGAYGTTRGRGMCENVTFINASSVGGNGSRKVSNPPIETEI